MTRADDLREDLIEAALGAGLPQDEAEASADDFMDSE